MGQGAEKHALIMEGYPSCLMDTATATATQSHDVTCLTESISSKLMESANIWCDKYPSH